MTRTLRTPLVVRGLALVLVLLVATIMAHAEGESTLPEQCSGFKKTERTRLVSVFGSYAWKHASYVHSLSVSREGTRAVSGDEEGKLICWEVPSGRELRTILNDGPVYACAISPDGKRALSGSHALVKLWNLETGELIRTLEGHVASEGSTAFSIWAMAFSPDGKRGLSGSADRTARLWDLETGKELRQLKHGDGLTSVAISPDGKRALTSSWDGTVQVWDLETGSASRFASEKGPVRSLAFLPDGKQGLAAGDVRDRETGWIEVFDLETGKPAPTHFFIPEAHVSCVAISPDGGRVVVGIGDRSSGQLKLQHVGGDSVLTLVSGETMKAVAFLPDGEHLLRASGSRIFLHDLTKHAPKPGEPSGSHKLGVTSLAVSSSGDRVVAAGADAKVWEVATGKETPIAGSCGPVALLPDGRLLSGSTSDPSAIRLLDLASGAESVLHGPTGSLARIVATPDGKRALSVGWDGKLRIFDLERKTEERTIDAHEGGASALALTPDGKLALTGGAGAHSDSSVKLWEVETGKLIRTLDGDALSSRQGVGALAFSPDGKRALVSGSTFELWEVETGKLLWWLKDALGGTGAAFSPDGRVLVDAVGRTIVLYDGETGKVLDRIDLATSHDRVESLALSSDGRFLCAGTARGVVLRFEVTTGGGR